MQYVDCMIRKTMLSVTCKRVNKDLLEADVPSISIIMYFCWPYDWIFAIRYSWHAAICQQPNLFGQKFCSFNIKLWRIFSFEKRKISKIWSTETSPQCICEQRTFRRQGVKVNVASALICLKCLKMEDQALNAEFPSSFVICAETGIMFRSRPFLNKAVGNNMRMVSYLIN